MTAFGQDRHLVIPCMKEVVISRDLDGDLVSGSYGKAAEKRNEIEEDNFPF